MTDKNGKKLKVGNVIDINQTVNGQSRFYISSLYPLIIYYDYDRSRRYEYNEKELLSPCKYSGEVDFEIIDN